ncbi:MAG TPA: GatB/YqeY domain-containing protein [Silvibacterium sp.]|nr:GatB/YqeY domain-containing protein [Silvibacterium sp.]
MTHVSIAAQIEKDIIAAMKARDQERTTALRMVKTALKNREIDKRAPLDETESIQVLTTLIKQRRDSVEQFTKGNRPELAAKETSEIELIEGYMPKAAGEQEIRKIVEETLAELASSGAKPGPKDMGTAMKAVQARIQATGLRADGRQVSEIVKGELAK